MFLKYPVPHTNARSKLKSIKAIEQCDCINKIISNLLGRVVMGLMKCMINKWEVIVKLMFHFD